MKKKNISSYIDYTNLKQEATRKDIESLCKEAIEHGCKGVCVNSYFIPIVANILKNEKIIPIAVVGFPLGANQSSAKAFEAKEAISFGAKEIDMVINIGALKEKNYKAVFEDIKMVVEEIKPFDVKTIIETPILNEEEIIIATTIAQVAGAKFIKTSTGFSKNPTKVEDVLLIKKIIGDDVKIKASGGIKEYMDVKKMIEAGADRIGTSSLKNILKG